MIKITAELSDVRDELRDIRDEYDQRSASLHDPAPLRQIRQAVSRVRQETRQMELRTGWLQAKLLALAMDGGNRLDRPTEPELE